MNQQGTEAWFRDRLGRATASEFGAVLAKGEGKTRAAYMRRLVTERLTGKPAETYMNGHMARGQAQEPFARLAYENAYGEPVEEVGFIKHPDIMSGCSPDGLIGKRAGGEFKCVVPTVQLETILRGKYPPEHRPQIMGNLWITARDYWDFVSFSPDMPAHLRLYVYRVERDEAYIKILDYEVRKFLQEVDELYLRLMGEKQHDPSPTSRLSNPVCAGRSDCRSEAAPVRTGAAEQSRAASARPSRARLLVR